MARIREGKNEYVETFQIREGLRVNVSDECKTNELKFHPSLFSNCRCFLLVSNVQQLDFMSALDVLYVFRVSYSIVANLQSALNYTLPLRWRYPIIPSLYWLLVS